MQIKALLERGVEHVYPSREFLEEKLRGKDKLTVYLGVDPTVPTMHLGHAIALRKLAELQKLGHKIILLIGDFTATIGDPDKLSTRVPLTEEQVLENCKNYKEQASNFINFEGNNPAELKFNSTWLKPLNFAEVLTLASKMTVQQMIERDLFARRIKEGNPIRIHEFLYPLMQGYDSVAMKVDGEIGGNDQTFNMLAGRTLMKEMIGKEKFVIALKLLADSSGVKMGKTTGNMVALNQTPEEMFGAVMSWSDEMILSGFELCTDADISEIDVDGDPMGAKMRLASEIVKTVHGEDGAEKGRIHFEKVVQKKELPGDIQEIKTEKGALLSEVLTSAALVKSKSDFGRLLKEGAIEIIGEGILENLHYSVEASVTVRVGKRRFAKIVV